MSQEVGKHYCTFQLKTENKLLKQKISTLERRQLQNNIILSGL